jgi:hypothetical protein
MPQEIAGCPGNTKIASGILIHEPAPQIEQPPSGGISRQVPGGVGAIGALVVGAGVGAIGAAIGANGVFGATIGGANGAIGAPGCPSPQTLQPSCSKAATTRLASVAKRMRIIFLAFVCEQVNNMHDSLGIRILFAEKP